METIRTYIQNLFVGIPKTEQSERIKINLIRDSEERYDELIAQGKSEAEALGTVIQHLGSMDDIHAELGVHPAEGEGNKNADPVEKQKMAASYSRFRGWYGIGIAVGVALCIWGIVLGGILSTMFHSDTLTILGFFIPIIVAVSIFILLGLKKGEYTDFFRANQMNEYLSEDEQLSQDSSQKIDRKKRKTASSMIWTLATLIYLCLGFLFHLWHPGWLIFLAAGFIESLIQWKS